MNSEFNRLITFINWPSSAPVDPIRVSKAGFFYTGQGTEVQCFSCGGKISYWDYGDQVMWRHRNLEPSCTFVVNPQLSGNIPFNNDGSMDSNPLAEHRGNLPNCNEPERTYDFADPEVGSSPEPQEIQAPNVPTNNVEDSTLLNQTSGAAHNAALLGSSAGGTWRSLGVVGGSARHASSASLATRLATFTSWPADRVQEPHALAEAGFFYTGVDDQVRCFYCDGGLSKWEAGDAPWSEHARWFPHCGYVLLVKGQDFIDACKTKNNLQGTQVSAHAASTRRRRDDVNFPYTESLIEESMESSMALAALGAGLDAARVRRAIARRIRSTGVPFSSSEALIDAVLNEQLNEEAWSVSPSQRLARDILAETLREFAPRSGLIPSSQWNDERDSQEETTTSQTPSPTPLNRREADQTDSSVEPDANTEPYAVTEPNANTEPDTNAESSASTVVNKSNVESSQKKDSPVRDKTASLEEENRQLKEARLCKVCMDSEVSVVFLPCGHLVSCARCGAALSACPLCRADVRALVRAYLA